MLADVGVRPAVEPAVAHRRDEIRHEIVAEVIAFVDGGPQHAGAREEREADGISKAAGKHPVADPSGLYSLIAARRGSLSGVALVADPTVTYIFVPAGLKMTLRVQWL